MAQKQQLERVLDLLLSENSAKANELLHQIIVEKARSIYESIVDDEEPEVGGDEDEDFTSDISSDQDDIDADEQNDGEAEGDDDFDDEDDSEGDFGADDSDMSTEDRVEDLESQLAELRAEFDELMGEEMQEPEHADLAADDEFADDDFADDGEESGIDSMADVRPGKPNFGGNGEEQIVGEVVARLREKKKADKLKVAPQTKKIPAKGGKKVDEETKFLNQVADTGQRGTAKLVGTGKGMTLGAEQNQSPYTRAPNKKDYGGSPTKIGSGKGGEYGTYNGTTATNKTPTDNTGIKPKNVSTKADTTPKLTGGKSAGTGNAKSPLSKKPA